MPGPYHTPNAYRQKMVVLTATDGKARVVVSPEQLADFIQAHKDCVWVAHNLRFDYWVMQDELTRRECSRSKQILVDLVDSGHMRDTMLLDFLIRLATCKKPDALRMRGLGDFQEYGIKADKKITVEHNGEVFDVRTGFGRFLGRPIGEIPNRMLDYAVWDTVATYDLFQILEGMAGAICKKTEYGFLTEQLQVRADICLSDIGKRGFALDQGKIDSVLTRMWGEIQELIQWFVSEYPLVFEYYSPKARAGLPGSVKIKKDTGLPAMKEAGLLEYLSLVMKKLEIPEERVPRTPGSKTRPSHYSLSLEPWKELAQADPFVEKWVRCSELTDMYGKVKKLKGQERMYADYRVLKVTGRTSCTGKGGGVNIQAWDRAAEMRALYIAGPDNMLVIVDYSAIELRTLASVCIDRFGFSKLGEVFKKGIDPHAYTAAMFTEVDPLVFMGWKKTNPDKYKKERQGAKAINFGVPGGLGPVRLSGYAHAEYGVDLSIPDAKVLRDKLIKEVYPELSKYLRDTTPWVLGTNLHLSANPDLAASMVLDAFQVPFPGYWYAVQKIVGFEQAQNMNNKDYSAGFKQSIWTKLNKLNRNPDLKAMLRAGKPSAMLRRLLFGERVITRTGRVRAGADYGEARNTPFQGLAADGAKVAMWEMHKQGLPVVAFIHDEFVVEVSEAKADDTLKQVSQIMVEGMKSVVGNGIPIDVEGQVSKVWKK